MKAVSGLVMAFIFMYVGVNLLSMSNTVDSEIATSVTTSTSQDAVIQYSSFTSPYWVLIVFVLGIVGLIVCWYIGRKHKYAILGDNTNEET